jgi:hypothetical protein
MVALTIQYYPTEGDAIANTNSFGATLSNYVVGNGGPFGPGSGYTVWNLAPNSTGSSPTNVSYTNGMTLNSDGFYYVYPASPCFLEGSKILCFVKGQEVYVPIETLREGDLVKTSLNGYKKVEMLGSGAIANPGTDERLDNRLYKCSPSAYPQLTEDLYLTGFHSILVDSLTKEQKKACLERVRDIYVTDKKYRLIASLDERAVPWNSEGVYTIWHVALENTDERMNYGIYANGLLVESCSINFMKNKSNLKY